MVSEPGFPVPRGVVSPSMSSKGPEGTGTNRPQVPTIANTDGSRETVPQENDVGPVKLSKRLKIKEIEPKTEKDLDELLDDYELRAPGLGGNMATLKAAVIMHLSRRTQARVGHLAHLPWPEWRDKATLALFPHHTRLLELKQQMARPKRLATVAEADVACDKLVREYERVFRRRGQSLKVLPMEEHLLFKMSIPTSVYERARLMQVEETDPEQARRFRTYCYKAEGDLAMEQEAQPRQSSFNINQIGEAGPRTIKAKGKCWACGEEDDHFKRECPNIGQDKKCTTCGSSRHTSAVCKEKRLKGASTRTRENSRSLEVKVTRESRREEIKRTKEELEKELKSLDEELARQKEKRLLLKEQQRIAEQGLEDVDSDGDQF